MMENGKPVFRLSLDTRTIYERLIKAKIGEIVSYEELSAAIQSNVRSGSARSSMQSARRKALALQYMVFDAVTNVGLKRLNDSEIVGTSQGALRRMRRMAKRSAQKLGAVQSFDTLSDDKKIMHNASMSAFRAVATLFSSNGMRRIEEGVEKAQKPLEARRTLKLFDRRT